MKPSTSFAQSVRAKAARLKKETRAIEEASLKTASSTSTVDILRKKIAQAHIQEVEDALKAKIEATLQAKYTKQKERKRLQIAQIY